MSLLGNLPHTCTAYRRVRERDAIGGNHDTLEVVFTGRSCWQQAASANEVQEYAKRGINVTNKVYFATVPELDERHILVIGSKVYEVVAYADPDASAGLNVLHKVFVELSTTGSTTVT